MAQVVFFVYSEGAGNENQDPAKKPIIVNPLTKLSPPFIPSLFSFTISAGIEGISTESQHTMKLSFKNPSGDVIADLGTIALNKPNDSITAETQDLFFNIDIKNAVIETQGEYSTEIMLDEESLGDFKIKAVVNKKG